MGHRGTQYIESQLSRYIRANGLIDGRIAKSISMIVDSLDLLERLDSVPSPPVAQAEATGDCCRRHGFFPPSSLELKNRHTGKFRFYDSIESNDLVALLSARVVLDGKMMFVSDLIGKIKSVDDGVFAFDGVQLDARDDNDESREVRVMALLELEICARFIHEAEQLEQQYGSDAYPEIIAILRRTGRMDD